jgi:molybdopterin-guanine dinucleotide biosynthesis protein A
VKKHVKHPPLVRSNSGRYARHELAVMGTTCAAVESFVSQSMNILGSDIQMAYFDAAHQQIEGDLPIGVSGGSAQLTDCIRFFRRDEVKQPNEFDLLFANQTIDLLFVNGNHFPAKQQIIVIDPAKEASLKKRIAQIVDPVLILCGSDLNIFDFLQSRLDELKVSPPVIDPEDSEALKQWWISFLAEKKAPIKALILAGGDSIRMGQSKAEMQVHGMSQTDYLGGLCERLGIEFRISVKNKADELPDYYWSDRFIALGPYGAILSAFMREPDTAWLVLACDMPGIDLESLEFLIRHRNLSRFATVFHSKSTGFPDPFPGIYEPRIYQRMLNFLALGHSCPRKVLINSDTEIIDAVSDRWLFNVNTPGDLEEFMTINTN